MLGGDLGHLVGGGEPEAEPIYGDTYLPRKFKIGIAVPPSNDVDVFSQDLGYIAVTDAAGKLTGLFTDSDLARLFEQHQDAAFDRPIRDVMTPRPLMVPIGTRLTDAVDILRNRKISELPVVDANEIGRAHV